MGMKKCKCCGLVKDETEFSLVNGGRVGSRCKVCAATFQREFYAENAARLQLRRSARNLVRRASAREVDVKIIFEGEEL